MRRSDAWVACFLAALAGSAEKLDASSWFSEAQRDPVAAALVESATAIADAACAALRARGALRPPFAPASTVAETDADARAMLAELTRLLPAMRRTQVEAVIEAARPWLGMPALPWETKRANDNVRPMVGPARAKAATR